MYIKVLKSLHRLKEKKKKEEDEEESLKSDMTFQEQCM